MVSVLNCMPVILVMMFYPVETVCKYSPDWKSLDARPIPPWYDEAKFGIFINWGVYSVPSFGSEWFWWYWHGKTKKYVDFMNKNYRPGFTYADFAPMFTAEFYDPNQWTDIIKASGARYVVYSTKHHEGFTLWPSKVSFNWNAMDVGPHRDLVGEFAIALRNRTNIHFGVYHSLFEWFNKLFLLDQENKFKTRYFVDSKALPELYELVNTYQPEIIWSDGDWEAPDTYWNSTEFLAWLYNDSPVKETVVVNDRWGSGDMCHHGDFYTCRDRYNPGVLQKHKWENAMTIDRGSWGFRREASLSDYLSIEDLVSQLVGTVSCGGNLLMNIGPTHDGRIVPIFEERLRQMGAWLKVNGDAIYGSKPWTHQNDTVTKGVWYTSSNNTGHGQTVYSILLNWPTDDLILGAPQPTATTTVGMLGRAKPLTWINNPGGGLKINLPSLTVNERPCKWAWVVTLNNVT